VIWGILHINTAEQRTIIQHTVIDTLAVNGWAVTFGTARRDWVGPQPAQAPPRCTKCNSPPINGPASVPISYLICRSVAYNNC